MASYHWEYTQHFQTNPYTEYTYGINNQMFDHPVRGQTGSFSSDFHPQQSAVFGVLARKVGTVYPRIAIFKWEKYKKKVEILE